MGQFCLSSRVAARPSAASPLSLFSLFNPGGLHSSSGSPASCALYIYKRLYPSLKLFVDFALQFSRTYVPQEVYQPLESPRFWFVGGHAASPCLGVRVRFLLRPRTAASAYCRVRVLPRPHTAVSPRISVFAHTRTTRPTRPTPFRQASRYQILS